MKLTEKQIKDIAEEAARINSGLLHAKAGSPLDKRKKELTTIQNKNGKANMKLEDSCFFGPLSAAEMLEGTDLEEKLKDDTQKIYYIMALENVLGKSTTMEYDKNKNAVFANTPNHGDKLVYDPKDVELGLWDKICEFFGFTTEHAKKVEFAQKSIQAQKDKLAKFNKLLVKQKKDNFVEKHKDFAQRNEAVVNEAEKTENEFKKLFFGTEKVNSYKFKNGEKLSPVVACIAMYHQEGDKDIANMSLEEINKPENEPLRNRLREIGNEYKELVSDKSKGLDEQIAHLDDFLITSDKFSTRDKGLLSRMATDKSFEIDWNKAEKNITDKEQQKEMAGAKAFVMLKVKAQLRNLVGEKFPNGKKSGFGLLTKDDMKHVNAFKAVREYKMFMDAVSAEKYDKAVEHLGKLKVEGLEGFEMKPENYNEFLDKADSIVSQKELNAPTKESNEIDEINSELEFG